MTRSGETRWVWERGRGIYADNGEVLFLEGFITDITERRKAGEALERAREDLEQRVRARTAELTAAIDELRKGIAGREWLPGDLRKNGKQPDPEPAPRPLQEKDDGD